METAHLRGFRDELEKISGINLMGLSPDKAIGNPAPPMETTGLQQATAILGMVNRDKTAAVNRPRAAREMASVETPGVSQATSSQGGLGNQGRNLAWSTLGGASAGRIGVDMAHPHTPKDVMKGGKAVLGKDILHHRRWKGLVGGAAVGAGIYAGRKMLQHNKQKQKTSAVAAIQSPKMALKAAQQTAKPKVTGPSAKTPSISTQTSGTIGRSFRTKG
jgi:hypothetical protein